MENRDTNRQTGKTKRQSIVRVFPRNWCWLTKALRWITWYVFCLFSSLKTFQSESLCQWIFASRTCRQQIKVKHELWQRSIHYKLSTLLARMTSKSRQGCSKKNCHKPKKSNEAQICVQLEQHQIRLEIKSVGKADGPPEHVSGSSLVWRGLRDQNIETVQFIKVILEPIATGQRDVVHFVFSLCAKKKSLLDRQPFGVVLSGLNARHSDGRRRKGSGAVWGWQHYGITANKQIVYAPAPVYMTNAIWTLHRHISGGGAQAKWASNELRIIPLWTRWNEHEKCKWVFISSWKIFCCILTPNTTCSTHALDKHTLSDFSKKFHKKRYTSKKTATVLALQHTTIWWQISGYSKPHWGLHGGITKTQKHLSWDEDGNCTTRIFSYAWSVAGVPRFPWAWTPCSFHSSNL